MLRLKTLSDGTAAKPEALHPPGLLRRRSAFRYAPPFDPLICPAKKFSSFFVSSNLCSWAQAFPKVFWEAH